MDEGGLDLWLRSASEALTAVYIFHPIRTKDELVQDEVLPLPLPSVTAGSSLPGSAALLHIPADQVGAEGRPSQVLVGFCWF